MMGGYWIVGLGYSRLTNVTTADGLFPLSRSVIVDTVRTQGHPFTNKMQDKTKHDSLISVKSVNTHSPTV